METRAIGAEGLNHLRELGHARDAGQRRAALREVAREFEAVFMYQVVKAMRQTVPKGGLVEKGAGEEVFEGMLDEEWAKKLSSRGGPTSLSEVLYRQLSRAAGLEEEGAATPLSPAAEWRSLIPAAGRAGAGKKEL
jgi:flagellar protein FlgJ